MTRQRAALLAIAGVAFALRLTYVAVVDPDVPALGDARNYHLLGENLADGHGYVRAFDLAFRGVELPTAEFPPLFPTLLAGLTVIGADDESAQRVVMAALGAATAVLAAALGRRVGGRPAVGIVAGLVVAVHPLLVQLDGLPLAEALFVPLVLGVLLAVDRRPYLAGALLGLAALTRSEALLLLPLVVVPVAWRRRRWGHVGAAALATVVVLAPWTIRNWSAFDRFVPTSHNLGTALAGANCDATYEGEQLGGWVFDCVQLRRTDGLDDEAAQSRDYREEGIEYATDHAGRWPAVVGARLLRTWSLWPGDDAQLDTAVGEGRDRDWELAATWLDRLLLPLAAVGALILVRARRPVAGVVGVPLALSLATAATYGNPRFRAAAVPVLAVLAAVSVVVAVTRRPLPSDL